MEICGDNRFEIIARAKADLLESTNIETDEAEMAVIDNILFRCWQMGWLDRYADRKTEPQICDTCRYYNSYIPCGSIPSACKEADKFAEEFVDGLKKLKPQVEPQTERSNE